ncbi:hypothetical protein PybrP1_005476 [[Pythium] brassicae (nom. inval.)]|nr:hypothetical protein PybrP1_005476 [[Pythium] brassicae (nom. inval.)]
MDAAMDHGSNEDIKAVVLNYGKWRDAKAMETFLAEHGVAFLKVQKARQLSFGFVHFASREERDAALPVLRALTWFGEPLDAKDALVKRSMQSDRPRGKKRKHHERQDGDGDGDGAEDGDNDAPASAASTPATAPTSASEVVTPWASVPYEEQLARKEAEMKKVLVKIVRNTRKEYGKKEKRVDAGKRANNKNNSKSDAAVDGPVPAHHKARAEFPHWLTSHGSMFVVADGALHSRVHEADESAAWTREADAAGVVAIVSFGSELVAAMADNTVCALTTRGAEREWVRICDGPGAAVASLASLRGTLLCCTADGRVLKQEGTGRFASGAWTQIGAVDGARFIGLYNGFLYAYCPGGGDGDASSEQRWWRAPLTSDALEALAFEPWRVDVTADVLGMTSHNAQLILLTARSLEYVMGDGRVVLSAPVALSGEGDSSSGSNVFTAFASHKGLCCPTDSIHPSPVTDGYRNKCEFSVGLDAAGAPCVGFRLGLFRDGVVTIGRPDDCVNVSRTMKAVCSAMQQLLDAAEFPVYDVTTQAGVWRMLTVRESERTGGLMVVVQVKPPATADARDALRHAVVAAFTAAALPFRVTSIFLHEYAGVSAPTEDDPVTHVFGDATIEEELLGLRFAVSPGAFFQVNTRGAETLYALVKEHARADARTLLYDVCCGTGTIGLCAAAGGAGKVVGIELCRAATDDAAANAARNGVTNASFVNARAEDVMKDLLRAKRSDAEQAQQLERVVAIVDPPRAGLHFQVLRALRGCRPVERVVYVSCNPTGSLIQDAMVLCGPTTKTLVGDAFEPVHAIPVDMFPHTPHCEMIIVFERVKRTRSAPTAIPAVTDVPTPAPVAKSDE